MPFLPKALVQVQNIGVAGNKLQVWMQLWHWECGAWPLEGAYRMILRDRIRQT